MCYSTLVCLRQCSILCYIALPTARSCAVWDDNNKENVWEPTIPAGLKCPPPSKTISLITWFEALLNTQQAQPGKNALLLSLYTTCRTIIDRRRTDVVCWLPKFHGFEAALYTIVPRSPFFAFSTPKYCRLQKCG